MREDYRTGEPNQRVHGEPTQETALCPVSVNTSSVLQATHSSNSVALILLPCYHCLDLSYLAVLCSLLKPEQKLLLCKAAVVHSAECYHQYVKWPICSEPVSPSFNLPSQPRAQMASVHSGEGYNPRLLPCKSQHT